MINLLSSYTKNIASFLIFISLVEIIIPTQKYKKYVSLILGFMLVFICIEPVLNVLNKKSISFEKILFDTNEINLTNKYDKHEEQNNKAVIQIYETELKKQLEVLISNTELYDLIDASFIINNKQDSFGKIEKLIVYVKPKQEKSNIINIKPIQIKDKNISNNLLDELDENTNKLKKLILDFYNLSEPNINIIIKK